MFDWTYIYSPFVLIASLLVAALFCLCLYVKCAVLLCLYVAGLVVRILRRLRK